MNRRNGILLLLLLGVLSLAAAAPTWLRTSGATPIDPDVSVVVTGTSAAPGVGAGALVLVASALALGLVGRIGRWLVIAVAAASGVVIASSAVAILRDPLPAATSATAEATGTTDLTSAVSVTVAPYLAAALGVLVVLAAVWVALSARGWQQASGRHEIVRTGAGAAAGSTAQGSAPEVAGAPETTYDDQAAWDSLTRGEDPSGR